METPRAKSFVHSASQSFECMFCFAQLGSLSLAQRQAHYERHLINDIDATDEGLRTAPVYTESPKHSSDVSQPGFRKILFPCKRETDIFWHCAHSTPPPPSYTPGLIPALRKGLIESHARGYTRRAILCCDTAVHISREPWDAGWGCGYRNFLMACAVLMNQTKQPLYLPLLNSSPSPSIRNLQIWIEAAWKEGFDPEGQRELKKLVNTSKWVGTSDLWVAFTSRAIPAELVDFKSEQDSQVKISDLVVDWVVKYFAPEQTSQKTLDAFESLKAPPIVHTDKMPFILQHDGHSRTVIGYEVDKRGATNLLVFDPAYKPVSEIRKAAISAYSFAHDHNANEGATGSGSSGPAYSLKRKRIGAVGLTPKTTSHEGEGLDLYGVVKKFRLHPKALRRQKEYQILYFPMTAPLTEDERVSRKEVRSTRIS